MLNRYEKNYYLQEIIAPKTRDLKQAKFIALHNEIIEIFQKNTFLPTFLTFSSQ